MLRALTAVPLAVLAGCLLLGALLLGTSCGGGSPADPLPSDRPRVLLVHAIQPGYTTDVVGKLGAFGVFQAVDDFQADEGTPSLARLQGYDAVLVMSDAGFEDATALGDVLADYLDAGGGIVVAMFGLNDDGLGVMGRFRTDDAFIIQPAGHVAGDGPFGLTVTAAAHPILGGVSAFGGGSGSIRPGGTALRAGATLVATWDDTPGTPLVATGEIGGQRRVDLGFFPPTSDVSGGFVDASSDAMRIVANALRWVAGDL